MAVQVIGDQMLKLGIDLDEIPSVEHQRILVVDDEPDTIFLIKNILRMAGYDVLSALNGRDALKKVKDAPPDMILLDLMMPEMDGWETLRFIREMSQVPVIIVSAIGVKEEIVRALDIGVDDYLTKPFFNAEVIARIRAVLRRAGKTQEISRLIFPQVNLTIDMATQEIVFQGKHIHLTPKEFAVMSVLAKHAPAIVSYNKISQAVWGEDSEDARKRTKYLIYLLRRKFETITSEYDLILNIDRLGYKLQTEK